MAYKYENIVEEFNKRNCKLVTSKEEYEETKNMFKNSFKLNYIASCGHNHNVFYNVFKSRNTGIICPSCKINEIGQKKKKLIENKEVSKISSTEQEFNFINQLKSIISNDLIVIKAFDGCNVDIIFKPKNILNDEWVGIQVKTTNKIRLTYSFHINNTYKNCLILLCCIEDNNIWLFPENIIGEQKKISIGAYKSKYNIYKVENIVERLNQLYLDTSKFNFELLNTPNNIYQQREQTFRKYREEKIPFLNFIYDEMEATVYDFKIDNFKIQEKITSINKINNSCIFQLCKNNGKINLKRNQIQYEINDNQFYWLNCDNKKTFFVIPEKILLDKGYIGNKKKNTKLKITIQDHMHFKSKWIEPYMFNYETIQEEEHRIRLLNILK
jgi:hypothetical protein